MIIEIFMMIMVLIANAAVGKKNTVPQPLSGKERVNLLAAAYADLNVLVDIDSTEIFQSHTCRILVVLQHLGGADVQDVVVYDTLSAAFSYQSHAGDGDYDPDLHTWLNDSLQEGQSDSLVITVVAQEPGTAVNRALLHSSTPDDSTTANNTYSDSVDILDGADIEITVASANTMPYSGQLDTLHLVALNHGLADALDLEILCSWPATFDHISSFGGGTYNANTNTWQLSALQTNEPDTVHLVFKALYDGAFTFRCRRMQSSPPDYDNDNDADSLEFSILEGADVTAMLSSTVDSLFQGQQFTCLLQAENLGSLEAGQVELTMPLDHMVTYVSNTGGYTPSTGLWSVGTLADQEQTETQVTLSADSVGIWSAVLTRDSSLPTDYNEDNDADTAVVKIKAGVDLSLSLAIETSHTPLTKDDTLTAVLQMVHHAGAAGRDLAVSYDLPDGLEYLDDSGDGAYNPTSGVWSVTNLSRLATASMSIRMVAKASGLFHHIIDVQQTTPEEYTLLDNADSVDTQVFDAADLALQHSVLPNPQYEGKELVFSYAIANRGPSASFDISTHLDIPDGMVYLRHLGEGDYQPVDHSWTLSALDSGEVAELTVTVRADTSGGPFMSSAHILSSGQLDPNDANNDAEEDVTITPSARIFLRLYLEGPYRLSITDATCPSCRDTVHMTTKLRYHPKAGYHCLIPTTSPYEDGRIATAGNPDLLPEQIVDWVYVQFRPADGNGYSPEILLDNGYTGMSGFLRNDGALLDEDGREGLLVPGLARESYFVVVSHRNHLKVMSSTALDCQSLTGYNFGQTPKHYYDFTQARTQFFTKSEDYQRGCHPASVQGRWLMAAGDGDSGHQVENLDWDLWFSANGLIVGYFTEDYDLGGQVEGRDETLWYDNLFLRSPFSWDMSAP